MKTILISLVLGVVAVHSSFGQTLKNLTYNASNGEVIANTGSNVLTFTNPLQFATNSRAITRTNLSLGATWLTNTNVTNFRTDINLGTNSEVIFGRVQVGSSVFSTSSFSGGDFEVTANAMKPVGLGYEAPDISRIEIFDHHDVNKYKDQLRNVTKNPGTGIDPITGKPYVTTEKLPNGITERTLTTFVPDLNELKGVAFGTLQKRGAQEFAQKLLAKASVCAPNNFPTPPIPERLSCKLDKPDAIAL